MIRKLVLPVLALAMLGGCVSDYAYRGGDRGDYYYGQPSTEYRYEGPYGGGYSPYGSPYAPYGYGGGYAPYGYGGGYAPYRYGGFGYGSYGYPRGYYGGPYRHGGYYIPPHHHRRPPVTYPGPDGTAPPPRVDNRRPPWRNLDELGRRPPADGGGTQARAPIPSAPIAEPRERGSRMEQVIRRANRDADSRPLGEEP